MEWFPAIGIIVAVSWILGSRDGYKAGRKAGFRDGDRHGRFWARFSDDG